MTTASASGAPRINQYWLTSQRAPLRGLGKFPGPNADVPR
jgi:hypothetical protein